jgi:hypothetical protein
MLVNSLTLQIVLPYNQKNNQHISDFAAHLACFVWSQEGNFHFVDGSLVSGP